MIFTELTNPNTMDLCGMASQVTSGVINVPADAYDPNFSFCLYECSEAFPVWGGGSLDWQNDKTTFAFIRTIPSDTGLLSLWKNGDKVADITNNTYGEWTSSYTDNPQQYSFIADWDKIYQAEGVGKYQIRNSYTSLGVSDTYYSRIFELSLYNDRDADGWVKFDWFQEGDILRSPFKFNTRLLFSFKMKGHFLLQAPETIKDGYENNERDVALFRTEQKNKFLFNSKFVNEADFYLINENLALANVVTVTDFNLFGTNYKEKDLSFVSISNIEDNVNTRKVNISMTFEDARQDLIKDIC